MSIGHSTHRGADSSGSKSNGRYRTTEASRGTATATPAGDHGKWTFLTNHAHVMIELARDPSSVLREVARRVGITERAVQRIVADLEEAGYIERERVGRRNHYRIDSDQPLRHPVESHCSLADMLGFVLDGEGVDPRE